MAPFREALLRNWDLVREEAERFAAAAEALIRETGVYSNPLPYLKGMAPKEIPRTLLHLDGEWFFPESYEAERVKRVYGEELLGLLEEPRRALERLLHRVEMLALKGQWRGPSAPQRYYVLLVADGDRMGELVSGRFKRSETGEAERPHWKDFFLKEEVLPPEWREQRFPITPHFHRFVAERLRRFALELVPRLVEGEHLARLVYAGGDDVLALGAVTVLPGLIEGLRGAYGSKEVFDGGATLSVAAVVAHHRTPFRLVVEEGLRMLKKYVKEELGRNAWGIKVMRRSGEVSRFGAGFGGKGLWQWGKVVEIFRRRGVSPRVRAKLGALGPGLEGLAPDEVERLVRWAVKQSREEGYREGDEEVFVELYRSCAGEVERIGRSGALESFLSMLEGALFVAGRG